MSDGTHPAFPVAEDHKVAADVPWTCGLSKREWLAGQAMAMYANELGLGYQEIAKECYAQADAMIAVGKAAAQDEDDPWFDISTAPKDGTTILACVAGFTPCTAQWFIPQDGAPGRWLDIDPESFGSDEELGEYLACMTYEPTHWMPVPATARRQKGSRPELPAGKKSPLQWLEDETCDLRCISVATGGDDYDVDWVLIDHYQADPPERVVGRGRTPIDAIRDAQKNMMNQDFIALEYFDEKLGVRLRSMEAQRDVALRRVDAAEGLMKRLYRGYVQTMEAGRDRIKMLGGD